MNSKAHLCQVCIAVMLWSLFACTPLPTSAPTPTPSIPSPTVSEAAYQDNRLCFTVTVPTSWQTDGVRGGFASFTPPDSQSLFRITNATSGDQMTLERALADLRRGSLGPSIQEVKEATVDGQPAVWITLAPDAQFSFVVLVIAPDCGDAQHALFISASRADQTQFEAFLRRVRIA